MARRLRQTGSVFFALFAAVGMVGALGVAGMNVLKGPVRAMSHVTKHTIAENNMIASGRLALLMSADTPGDCDGDGQIEPLEWSDAGGLAAPANGGHLPTTIGASLKDPWGNHYGYCSWDHGDKTTDIACGATANRLAGGTLPSNPVIAVISAGPDGQFQTGCMAHGGGNYLLQMPNNDDLVLRYSYAEAMAMGGGLWNLKTDDASTATIAKNLSVTDGAGAEQLVFDAASKEFALGDGGTGNLPNIKTDFIQNLTANAPVEFLTPIKAGAATISTEEANAVAAIVTASGGASVGLKASGTSKAIEAQGLIDMTGHKIINLAAPEQDGEAATKKYVDDKFKKRVKCEAFVFSGCTGGATQSLNRSTLGDCKKACEDAGVQCCVAQYGTLASNPNIELTHCTGYTTGKPNSALVNLIVALIFPASVGAYCYEQY